MSEIVKWADGSEGRMRCGSGQGPATESSSHGEFSYYSALHSFKLIYVISLPLSKIEVD